MILQRRVGMKKIELLQELLDYITNDESLKFRYSYYFPWSELTKWFGGDYVPSCGTTACLAGHAAIKWNLYHTNGQDVDCVVANFIGLTEKESKFLFLENCTRANKEDAAQRLQWLIDGNNVDEYDFTTESWYIYEED